MSQKKRVRVYKPGQIGNSMNSWFMQMGGIPQQPQQQDMSAQVIQYAQQMIIEGEDPNNVYDDLVNQGVPSQLAAQVIEQIMESIPPQPAYSQPSQEQAMYNQEVEGAEEAVPDYLSLTGFDEDEDDEDDFKKGGMTKNKFIKEYKKLKLGGQKPDEIPGIQSAGFLGTVQNEANNYKIQKEAEEMYNNPFAVNALSQFVYGGSLPKAQDAGGAGAITKADFDKYVKEQEERYKQLEQRSNQGYRNYPQQNDPYIYGNPYGRGYGQGYGNVPTMFNPYGRRGPIFQRSPYLQNFPGADFQGMQLSNFKIDTEQVDRKGLLKFLGPKTRQTWSGEWTRNPQTGAVTPTAGTTSTTTPNKPVEPTTPSARPGSVAPGYVPSALGPGFSGYNADTDGDGIPDYLSGEPVLPAQTAIQPTTYGPENTPRGEFRTDYSDPRFEQAWNEQKIVTGDITDQNKYGRYFPDNTPAKFDFETGKFIPFKQQGGYLPKAQVGPPPEIMPNPFDQSPYQQRYQEQMDTHPFYRDYINKIKAGETVTDEERTRANTLFDETLEPMDNKMMGDYNEFMEFDPNSKKRKDSIKDATTIDYAAAYDKMMYGAKSITNSLNDNMEYRDSLANSMGMAAGPEQSGQTGNYTVNQSANFRPDLDGQIQYSQYDGQFELGEETEMTDEEIEKFLKGGGKLRFV